MEIIFFHFSSVVCIISLFPYPISRPNYFSGNKIDREDREIPTEVGEEFSQRHGMYFLETSAKASDNVERLFTEIAQDLLQVNFQSFQRQIQSKAVMIQSKCSQN